MSSTVGKELIAILLIDDDEEDYILTRDVVESLNHRFFTLDWVDSFVRGRDLMAEQAHDVYLIDYRLGPHTGLELIEFGIKNGIEAPLILLTGQDDTEIDEKALSMGASDYLVKSELNASILERTIRYSMQKNRIIKQVRHLNFELEDRVMRRTRALSTAVHDLRRSQQLYQAMAHNYPNGAIGVLDRDFNILFFDGQELDRFELYSTELEDQSYFSLFPKEDRQFWEYYLQRLIEGEHLVFEYRLREHVYSVRGVPLKEADGEIKRILIVANNISSHKKAEAEIRKALEKEKAVNEMKSRFISMASHEFRTPLSTILSSVSLIGKYLTTEDQHQRDRHIRRIKNNVSALTKILDEFLSASRLDEGKIALHGTEFELNLLCSDTVEEMQTTARKGQVLNYRHIGPELVQLDKQLIRQILLNLLSNAVKYSEEGTQIHINTEVRATHVELEVRDEGIGIPEEEQVHLFERFYRAQNATNYQGTGLGLHIVKRYVDLMGGSIDFRSEPGKGTSFKISLPRKLKPNDRLSLLDEASMQSNTELNPGNKTPT